jgi:hypothetical protein
MERGVDFSNTDERYFDDFLSDYLSLCRLIGKPLFLFPINASVANFSHFDSRFPVIASVDEIARVANSPTSILCFELSHPSKKTRRLLLATVGFCSALVSHAELTDCLIVLLTNISEDSYFLFRCPRKIICQYILWVLDISSCFSYYTSLQSRFFIPRILDNWTP